MLLRWNALDQVYLRDAGDELRVWAEVPGLRSEDLTISFEKNTLLLRGERKDSVPEGYAVQRRERPALRFARAITLPARIDAEKISAKLQNGILELTLPKAAEERVRRITVQAA
ncbi:MAG TPA: Hsp20/alpha crystallin family protein [Polyangiales bacterium]|nr:Hsp20/alpha crystallin family protein [Polyangiales bacterium]